MRTREDMASFPNVWHLLEPSVSTEGFRTVRARFAIAASRIAAALSELATLRGNHAVQLMPRHLTETRPAPQLVALSVRASVPGSRGVSRG